MVNKKGTKRKTKWRTLSIGDGGTEPTNPIAINSSTAVSKPFTSDTGTIEYSSSEGESFVLYILKSYTIKRKFNI